MVLVAVGVGSREMKATGYRSEDITLLETFAGNAAVMLENDRLERSIGCSLAQGLHFGHPLAPMGLTSLLSPARSLDQILRVA